MKTIYLAAFLALSSCAGFQQMAHDFEKPWPAEPGSAEYVSRSAARNEAAREAMLRSMQLRKELGIKDTDPDPQVVVVEVSE